MRLHAIRMYSARNVCHVDADIFSFCFCERTAFIAEKLSVYRFKNVALYLTFPFSQIIATVTEN